MNDKYAGWNKQNKRHAYPNSTIAEALCEIHFDSDSSNSPDRESIIKNLKHELSLDYPSISEQTLKQYHAAINDRGISVKEDAAQITRWLFKHRERNHLIQLLPDRLTINEVEAYPGWDIFIKDIHRGWTSLNKVLQGVNIKRIELRYINLIPRKNFHEPISAWLIPGEYYPNAILNSTSGFLARNEFALTKDQRVIVTLSEPVQDTGHSGIIFDIDIIALLESGGSDWSNIITQLNRLHDIAWTVFSDSLSSKYEALLNGELL